MRPLKPLLDSRFFVQGGFWFCLDFGVSFALGSFPADSSSLGGEKGNIHRGMMMAVTEFLAMEDFDLMVEAVGVEEKE
ncbi:hypothetical protein SLEP1_g23448 [Rubroshorea leprosula]|uniref:Uncharacterized protein n=1 Tax=Rubroshorea leprosula TaxID=152421 RepID=A0AAV5JPH0_9ROSI|nr:hypothetical protein SLEP1_g23448 [Rubroshorea leprosula]